MFVTNEPAYRRSPYIFENKETGPVNLVFTHIRLCLVFFFLQVCVTLPALDPFWVLTILGNLQLVATLSVYETLSLRRFQLNKEKGYFTGYYLKNEMQGVWETKFLFLFNTWII